MMTEREREREEFVREREEKRREESLNNSSKNNISFLSLYLSLSFSLTMPRSVRFLHFNDVYHVGERKVSTTRISIDRKRRRSKSLLPPSFFFLRETVRVPLHHRVSEMEHQIPPEDPQKKTLASLLQLQTMLTHYYTTVDGTGIRIS
jgi:hypothetical protein